MEQETRKSRQETNNESELVDKINKLAESKFELIILDTNTGIVYRRNTDWEWAGGSLWKPIAEFDKPNLANYQERLHKNVRMNSDMSRELLYTNW